MAVFSVAFGFSTSYTWAVSWRLILGLTNGNVPALRSSISEICGPQHVVAGMTILASLRAPSMVFGTGIGGLLAQPAVRFPGVFSATGLLGRYPFLLPNLVGAWWALFVLALVVIYLPETKDDVTSREQDTETQRTSSDGAGDVTGTVTTGTTAFAEASPTSGLLGSGNASNSTKYQSVSTTSSGDDRGDWPNNGGGYEKAGVACGISPNDGDGGDNDDGLDETPALRRPGTIVNDNQRHGEEPSAVFGRNGLLANPLVKVFVVLACMVQALIMGFEEAYPLFALSTPDVGGLGWDTLQIGKVLVMTGVLMTAFQLALAPPVIKIIGIAAWQRLGFLVGVPAIAAVPAVKLLSWNNPSLFAVSVIANTLSLCSLSAVNLGLTIGSSTLGSSRTRGKLCGLVITAESFGRFVSPAVFATIYAWSISPSGSTSAHRLVDHNFAFYVLAAILAMCALLAWPTLTAEKMAKQDDVLVGRLQKRVPASKEERSSPPGLGLALMPLMALLMPQHAEGHMYCNRPTTRQSSRSLEHLDRNDPLIEMYPDLYNAGGPKICAARAMREIDSDVLATLSGGEASYPPYSFPLAENGNYAEPNSVAVRHGVCGDPRKSTEGPEAENIQGVYSTEASNWPVIDSYTTGQVIEVDIILEYSHWGHVEIRICNTADLADPGGLADQECFNMHQLDRDPSDGGASPIDPNYYGRYIVDPPCRKDGELPPIPDSPLKHMGTAYQFTGRWVLPAGLECTHCILQVHYVSGSRCRHVGYDEFDPPSWPSECAPNKEDWIDMSRPSICGERSVYPEEFWNCADISISQDGSQPPPTPATTEEPDTATVTPAPIIPDETPAPVTPTPTAPEPTATPDIPEATAAPVETPAPVNPTPTAPEPTAAPDIPEATAAPVETPVPVNPTPTAPEPTAAPVIPEATAAPDTPEDTAPPTSAGSGYVSVGCFKDSKRDRVLSEGLFTPDMTTELCFEYCSDEGSLYMATQFGIECWCSDKEEEELDHDRHGDAECDYKCGGNELEYCGGHDAFNLYSLEDVNGIDECQGTEVQPYEQCGGNDGYDGSTCCTEGYECVVLADCYSQIASRDTSRVD
eukprot:g5915.t1